MNKKQVLVVGGYGVVGSQIVEIIKERHPTAEITVGGRNPEKAAAKPGIRVLRINTMAEDPLAEAGDTKFDVVINSVNDPEDRLLLSAVRRGFPLVDITRWTERFQASVDRLRRLELQSPVVLASGWMGGTAALLAKQHADSLQYISRIDISVLYSLQDKAGPNSTDYMDRLTIPFEVIENRARRQVYPMTDPLAVQFPNGYKAKCYRLDTPDHLTLERSSHADTINFRIAFDSRMSTGLLRFMVRSGIWKAIGGPRFDKLRQSLLYNPGSGSPHHIVIGIDGLSAGSQRQSLTVCVTDPLGQTHLTALGAVLQSEPMLLEGKSALRPGVYYPEQLLEVLTPNAVTEYYAQHGVAVGVEARR